MTATTPPPAPEPVRLESFRSPTGNIGCQLAGGTARASRQDGITCRNEQSRGFFIAQDRYRLF